MKDFDENRDFPMRIEVTIKQKIVDNRFESFGDIKENAEAILRILKTKFDQTPKIKVPISAYKQNVN